MNQRDRDYEELLRRALRASADSVVPAEDGLERIRARLSTPHPSLVAWMMAGFSEVASRAAAGLQSVSDWLRPMPGAARERLRVTRPGPRRGGLARLRPTAVLAIAVFVVAGGALALTPLPGQAISSTAALIRSLGSGGPAGGTGGSPLSGGPSRNLFIREGTATSSTAPGRPDHRHVAAASCAVAASASRAASSTTCPSPAGQRRPDHRLPEPHWQPRAESRPRARPAARPRAPRAARPRAPLGSPEPTASPSAHRKPGRRLSAEPNRRPGPHRLPESGRQPDAEPGQTARRRVPRAARRRARIAARRRVPRAARRRARIAARRRVPRAARRRARLTARRRAALTARARLAAPRRAPPVARARPGSAATGQ